MGSSLGGGGNLEVRAGWRKLVIEDMIKVCLFYLFSITHSCLSSALPVLVSPLSSLSLSSFPFLPIIFSILFPFLLSCCYELIRFHLLHLSDMLLIF